MKTLLLALGVLIWGVPAAGQSPAVDRYEVGRRLRAFERAFEKADPAARARATKPLQDAVTAFFRAKLDEVSAAVDSARLALTGESPSAFARWGAGLAVSAGPRLLSGTDGIVTWARLSAKGLPPVPLDGITFRVSLTGSDGATVQSMSVDLAANPDGPSGTQSWPVEELPEGDHRLTFEVRRGASVLDGGAITISTAKNLPSRVAALEEALKKLPDAPPWERETLRHGVKLLNDLMAGPLETDVPAHQLLVRCEEWREAAEAGEPWFRWDRPGDFPISIPTRASRTPARLLVPKGLKKDELRPLVVALHGLGGSENLFFDGYGDGKIVDQCEARGWLLVAPRANLGAPKVPELIDVLAERLPIDRSRVILIGHSMGAGHAGGLVGKNPEAYAAAVLLGGGGGRDGAAVAGVPFFVGAGAEDFGLRAARLAFERLQVPDRPATATWKEYPNTEHFTVVQVALDDVFAWLDEVLKKPR